MKKSLKENKKTTGKVTELNDILRNIVSDIATCMLDCVSPDNIEDVEYVCETLDEIDELTGLLPSPLKLITNAVVENYILPILDEDYFDFIYTEELGEMVAGTFHVKGEKEILKMGELFWGRCEELAAVINDYEKGMATILGSIHVMYEEEHPDTYICEFHIHK